MSSPLSFKPSVAFLGVLALLFSLLAVIQAPVARAAEAGGSVDASGVKWQRHDLTATTDGTMSVQLNWDNPEADLNLRIYTLSDGAVDQVVTTSITASQPEQVSFPAVAGERYGISVQAAAGASDYTLLTNIHSSESTTFLGTLDPDRYTSRTHAFNLSEDGAVGVSLDWVGDGDLAVHLRSADGVVASVQTNAHPERATFNIPAGDYEWVVRSRAPALAAYELTTDIRSTGPISVGDARKVTNQIGLTYPNGATTTFAAHDLDIVEDGVLTLDLTAYEDADLNMFVRELGADDVPGTIVERSVTNAEREKVSLLVSAGDRYRVIVRGATSPTGFDLVASLEAPSSALSGTVDMDRRRMQSFTIPVVQPGLLTGALSWDDDADLTLRIRDADGNGIAFAGTDAHPEVVSAEALEPGDYTFDVLVDSGVTNFSLDWDLQVGPERSYLGQAGFVRGGPQLLRSHDYIAPSSGIATAELDWDEAADLDLYVREVADPTKPNGGPLVGLSRTGLPAETMSFAVEAGTMYRLYVGAAEGAAHYTLTVPEIQTSALAWTLLGTVEAATESARAYSFGVSTTGEVSGTLSWDDAAANLELYLMDGDGGVVASANAGQNPSVLSWPVEEGSYEWVVRGTSGASGFNLQHVVTADEPAESCSPLSSLPCATITPETPVELALDGTDAGLQDVDGEGIGFTMVDPPSDRLPADGEPSNAEVPGYEADLLDVTGDGLTITATRGIQYQTPALSAGTNTQLNALGVGVVAQSATTTVSSTVVTPDFDTSANSEKGGIWFGLDEDNLVNLTVQNQAGSNVRAQFQREVDGVASGTANEMNGPVFPQGTDVTLTMVLDAATNTATGSYQVGDGEVIELGTFEGIPESFFEGAVLSDGVSGPTSFAGVFATARNEATNSVTMTFGDFSVTQEEVPEEPNIAPEVLLTGDRTLFEGQQTIIPVSTFDEDGDEITVEVDGLPAGLTYADGDISGTLDQGTVAGSPYDVTVTGDDGTDTGEETFQITVVDDIALDINFQPAPTAVPDGFIADIGAGYGDRGDGLEYGWVAQGTDTPLDMTGNTRDRARAGIEPLLNTFQHMQYGDIGTVYDGSPDCSANECDPGAWEIAVPNGLYEVTVAVGDQPSSSTYDSLHALNVEGGVIIREFQANSAQEFLEATAHAGVTDGKLTVTAVGGANTKISYVQIRSLGAQPHATLTVPANRATDVSLDTAVSASVSVPGTGIAVDPDRQTSLTDEAVRLFKVTATGDVEVEGNRGSTGGNDTIAISPAAPLEPNSTYRYVIDGVLDGAGQSFAPFETTFTTGEGSGGDPGDPEEFVPVEGAEFEKVLLPTASGNTNGKYFASLVVHEGYLWATTIGQGMYRYEILPDGTLGAAENLNVLNGRAAVGLLFDENNPDLAWVTHATGNIGNESAKFGSTLSVIDFSGATPVVTDVFVNLPRSKSDHLSNSISYGPSGDGGAPWLYFLQGSNQAAGDVDGAWGARGETQLTAAVLRFDPQDALAQALADGPTDVKTAELGGAYDPYADGAPLEIYATGIRNAYDLLWHSNGHIYVPTNGTAGGANAPGVQDNGDGTFTMVSNQATGENGYGNGTDVTEECTTRRIDGQPYSGGSVPPIGNLPTQRDFLFDVEQGGFYGHPNPTRCEWVLNDGTAYNPDREPDPNYHGVAFDFDFNKSPNGVIEYTSNTFGGALQGRMMVIRFSANDDILTFQVAGDGEVLGTQPGTDIPGFTGYVDPLDLVEDTEVNPGNIYINQYNRGGEPQQLYLLRVPEGEQAAGIRADQDELIMSATLNGDDPTETRELTVTNLGSEPVEVSASVEGANAGDFTVDSGLTIPGGEASQIEVTFDPSGSAGIRTGSLVLGDGEGSVNVSLRALAFAGHQGGNEPTLQQVVDTFQFGISTGWSGLAGGTEPVAKGDEVLEPLFQRASDGPVTMTPVAAFAPQEDLPFGWYAAAEGPVTPTQVGVVANGQLQTLNPQLDSGGTSFDPGTGAFGVFYESNTFNRIGYTEDARNDSGGLHRARIYPLTGDRFLVAFEDAANGDYQDYVFVLDNVVAAGDGSEPPVTGETISVNFGTGDSALPQGYLRDFGEAYAERTAADQGGLSYGWVDAGSEPLSIIGNGRDRNLNDDQRLDTLVHMDLPEDASGGISGEATWEIALPDGDYEVTVSVGDAQDGGSPEAHTINVEGSNAIDAFPKSSAPNGSDDRHESATVTVEVTDGRLTVDQAGGENTKINYLDITPLLDEEPEPPAEGDPIKVNFQLETAPVPDGYLRDFGEPYAERAGVSQGEGLTFGWVDDQLLEPLDLVGNGRDRNLNDDQRLDTLMHMDLPEDSDGGVLSDGAWQIAVPNGQFEVTVSVGDPSKGDAPESHTINVEGVNAIEAFPNSSAANGSDARHTEGTVVVEVLDGALTVDQIGGINTKINYIDIVPMSSGTPVEQVVAQVNFQPAASVTPQGWLADTGQLFDGERGYGWVRTEGGADKAADTRERAGAADQADKTLVIMDDNQVPGVVDGEWEYALRNGEYQVEVSVGDPGYIDSVHGVEAEGVVVVDAFEPSALGDYYVGEATLEVTDGALTLASTGHNTKVQWVRITSFATGDVVPPQLSLAVDGQGDDGAYTGPVTVTVTATDRTLEFVNVTVDGSDTFNYTTPFEVTGTGNHTVEVTATDGAGNATTRSVEFVIVEVGEGDLTLTNPEAAPFHDRIVMSRIQSTASNPATASTGSVILGNEGSESIEVVALDIMDQSAFTLVDPPELPIAIGVGDTVSVSVEFIGTGSGQNTNFESALLIRHNGSEGPTTKVELGAIWQSQSEGGNEPDVDEIVEAFGFGTTIVGAGQQINNDGRLEAIGDEVLSATWKRFDTSEPVTVRQLAAFHTCCSNTASFGWHPVGNKNNWNVALTHQGQWAQSLLPRINGSSGGPAVNSFTPGPATWSWRIDPESSDWTLNNTTPDECGSGNEGCQLGHHLRLWPVKDRAGDAIPGSYLAAMDYSGINYDYNDNVYLLTNVEPANLVQP